jgi:hypothetical protein
MPGIHTIWGNSGYTTIHESDFSFTLHQENFKIKMLYQNSDYCTAISFHDEFPYYEWDDPEIHIVLQGLIYNVSDEDIRKKLKEIAENFHLEKNYKELLKNFVESGDGKYTVQIFDKARNKSLIFNDYLSQLSLFYYCKDGLFVCSTEIKTILNFIPKIRFNRSSLAEFLMFQCPLGNKTIFCDIFQLQPSKCMVLQKNPDGISIEVTDSTNFNCILTEPFKNKKESIDYLKNAFFESIENRVATLEKHGYAISAILRGGYDSRTVLAGLCKCTKNVDYFTNEYVRDESYQAEGIFKQFGSPGIYHKCSFENRVDMDEIGSLIYKTDGMINYVTTAVCYHDIEYIKKNWPQKSCLFNGYGGGFTRHPFKIFSDSLVAMCEAEIYSQFTSYDACSIVQLDPLEYKKELKSFFDTYPEKNPEDRLKRFYFECYYKLGTGIDNRERILCWPVSPLMNVSSMRAFFTRIPLEWTGFDYFIKFMKELDPRLTQTPIFDSNINLQSQTGIMWYEIRYRSEKVIVALLKTYMPSVLDFYHLRKYNYRVEDAENYSRSLEKFRNSYQRVSFSSKIFNRDFIEVNLFRNKFDTRYIVTLLIYFKEIENRFPGKIEW